MSATIVIERTYQARLAELWSLWTTKDGFESWWGPEGFRVEVGTLEARAGGALEYTMIAEGAEQVAFMRQRGQPLSHKARARFGEMRKEERLTLISLIDFFPDVAPYETTVAVDFHSEGASSTMVITLEPMHSEQFTQMAQAGWTSQLGKLARRYGM